MVNTGDVTPPSPLSRRTTALQAALQWITLALSAAVGVRLIDTALIWQQRGLPPVMPGFLLVLAAVVTLCGALWFLALGWARSWSLLVSRAAPEDVPQRLDVYRARLSGLAQILQYLPAILLLAFTAAVLNVGAYYQQLGQSGLWGYRALPEPSTIIGGYFLVFVPLVGLPVSLGSFLAGRTLRRWLNLATDRMLGRSFARLGWATSSVKSLLLLSAALLALSAFTNLSALQLLSEDVVLGADGQVAYDNRAARTGLQVLLVLEGLWILGLLWSRQFADEVQYRFDPQVSRVLEAVGRPQQS